MNLTLLDSEQPQFPPSEQALTEPNGLLAVGGNLEVETLVAAYRQGIFPWYSDGDPLLWWCPDPRTVLFPNQFYASKSLIKLYRQQRYQVTFNQAFPEVIKHCQTVPRKEDGTWIDQQMHAAYCSLHQAGHAHSVEVWDRETLVGGLYGVAVGGAFCGESMFSLVSNASKLAALSLVRELEGLCLIDCQIPNPHLSTLGAVDISRKEFLQLLEKYGNQRLKWPS
ncbi:leucyl/phenylalanyl-tRNA--protein transferase [bacterium SCSIO 12696]|nr:leucyl/phenylalanyl-tRNA--protein transferase [bacterium SCSIO 12696]